MLRVNTIQTIMSSHHRIKKILNLNEWNKPWQTCKFLVSILAFILFLIAVATLLAGGKNGVKSASFPPFTYIAPEKDNFYRVHKFEPIRS